MKKKLAWIIILNVLLMTIRVLASPMEHFDNGRMSFDIPDGWAAETIVPDRASVRIKANNSADTILVILDKSLPSDLKGLDPLIERRALAEVSSLFKSGTSLHAVKPCAGPSRDQFSRWEATECTTLIQDAEGYRAVVAYIGVPLKDTTCLIVEFSSSYKGDLEALQSAHEVVEKTINFCQQKPGASTQSGSAANPNQWRTYDSGSFSFQYPPSWQLRVVDKNEAWAGDTAHHGFSVRFAPGLSNKASTLNQCASEDDLLQEIYANNYEPQETSKAQYPYTSVTHDDFKPGWMGGRSTSITVVHVEAYQPPVTEEFLVEVVPRAGGMYVVTYGHPGEPMGVSEPVRRAFMDSIVLRSGALDKKAYCNYLGH